MQALRATLDVDFTVTRRPRADDTGAVSRPRGAAIGAVGGLIAGFAVALLISLVSGRLRTAEGIQEALGIELLADLRSAKGIPSSEHARQRLRALGDGSPPTSLLLVSCGDVGPGASEKVSAALGEGVEVRAAPALGEPGLLRELEEGGAWAIVATPGAVRRGETAALHAELDGVGRAPAGLFLV
jgi:hypothetical protein